MSLKTKALGLVGVATLGVAMLSGGAAYAGPTLPASIDISCGSPATASLGGNADFAPINILTQNDSETAAGAIELTVDMGCYWGGWSVDAQSSNFVAGPGRSFSANHLSLQDATVTDFYLKTGVPILDGFTEPDARNAYFSSSSDQDTILETNESFLQWLLTGNPNVPAPFVTTATYTGVLTDIPFLAFSGTNTYEATITVTLTLG
jgi:hypothetical protein